MEDKSFANIKKIVFGYDEKKLGGAKRIGKRFERFDPNAIDGDGDGIVQEQTSFERPDSPQMMPMPQRAKPIRRRERQPIPKPEELPKKNPQKEPEKTPVEEPVKEPEKVPGEEPGKVPYEPTKTPTPEVEPNPEKEPMKPGKPKKEPEPIFPGRTQPGREPKKRPGTRPGPRTPIEPQPEKPEPEKPEPAKPEPAKPEPAKPEPKKPEKPKRPDYEPQPKKPEKQPAPSRPAPAPLPGRPQPVPARLNRAFSGFIDTPNNTDDESETLAFSINSIASDIDKTTTSLKRNGKMPSQSGRMAADDDDLNPDDEDPLERWADSVIESIDGFLSTHQFNPEAMDYQVFEWTHGDQSQRYAPEPWGMRDAEKIDWDKLLEASRIDSASPYEQMTQDQLSTLWESALSDVFDDDRQGYLDRLLAGESIQEIADDVYYGWYDLASAALQKASIDRNQDDDEYEDAVDAAETAAIRRRRAAIYDHLVSTMKDYDDIGSLKRALRRRLEVEKNVKKRSSNEYQMIRKKMVEEWVKGLWLYQSKPKMENFNSRVEYADALNNWWDETLDTFEALTENIAHLYDITQATGRMREHQDRKIDAIENILSDGAQLQKFFDRLQNRYNPPSGPSQSGSMSRGASGIRGIRLSRPRTPGDVSVARIEKQIATMLANPVKETQRPKNLSPMENRIFSSSVAAKDFSQRFFNQANNLRRKKALGLR